MYETQSDSLETKKRKETESDLSKDNILSSFACNFRKACLAITNLFEKPDNMSHKEHESSSSEGLSQNVFLSKNSEEDGKMMSACHALRRSERLAYKYGAESQKTEVSDITSTSMEFSISSTLITSTPKRGALSPGHTPAFNSSKTSKEASLTKGPSYGKENSDFSFSSFPSTPTSSLSPKISSYLDKSKLETPTNRSTDIGSVTRSPGLFSPGFTHVDLPTSVSLDEMTLAVDAPGDTDPIDSIEISDSPVYIQDTASNLCLHSTFQTLSTIVQYSPANEEEMLEAVAFISSLPDRSELPTHPEVAKIHCNMLFNTLSEKKNTRSSGGLAGILPPKSPSDSHKLTLVLDLDETLVHCSVGPLTPCDLKFPITMPGKESSPPFQISVRWRPYLFTFLEYIKDRYEVVVFTASQKIYADALLDIMDPLRSVIKYRLFRESCRWVNGNFIKDLDVLGRDLSRTIIVDNAPQAYGLHVSNGYPIAGWYDDQNDKGLLHLLEFLERHLSHTKDIRPIIQTSFPLYHRVIRYKQLFLSQESPSLSDSSPSDSYSDKRNAPMKSILPTIR
jgi:CTD small phosphatase-like protein 2